MAVTLLSTGTKHASTKMEESLCKRPSRPALHPRGLLAECRRSIAPSKTREAKTVAVKMAATADAVA